jgi:hypothetical protein
MKTVMVGADNHYGRDDRVQVGQAADGSLHCLDCNGTVESRRGLSVQKYRGACIVIPGVRARLGQMIADMILERFTDESEPRVTVAARRG